MPKSKTSSPFHIRPSQTGEERILHDLIRELAAYEKKKVESLPLTVEKLRQYGFGQNPYFFTEFVEVEGLIVGYALYFYTFSAHQGAPVLYVDDLFIKPEYRKKGMGHALLKQLAGYAKKADCCRMEWHVFSWNEEAKDFYQKLGCEFREDLLLCRLHKQNFIPLHGS